MITVSPPSPAALAPWFLDWWFTPWDYAAERENLLPQATGLAAQRDGYRLWCSRAGIAPDLPPHFDASWQVVVLRKRNDFMRCARLFGGLFAAREHDFDELGRLPREIRLWCLSVALTQPLQTARPRSRRESSDGVEARGLLELALRLEQGFPGMWPRLALMLPPPLSALLASALAVCNDAAPAEFAGPERARLQRCWKICAARAKTVVA